MTPVAPTFIETSTDNSGHNIDANPTPEANPNPKASSVPTPGPPPALGVLAPFTAKSLTFHAFPSATRFFIDSTITVSHTVNILIE
jgi:hypothetical protein